MFLWKKFGSSLFNAREISFSISLTLPLTLPISNSLLIERIRGRSATCNGCYVLFFQSFYFYSSSVFCVTFAFVNCWNKEFTYLCISHPLPSIRPLPFPFVIPLFLLPFHLIFLLLHFLFPLLHVNKEVQKFFTCIKIKGSNFTQNFRLEMCVQNT